MTFTFDDKTGLTPEEQASVADATRTSANPDPGLPGELGVVAGTVTKLRAVDPSTANLATLVTAASLTQGHFKVETLASPSTLSLFGFIQLDSGERKTSAFDLLLGGVTKWQTRQWEHYKDAKASYDTDKSKIKDPLTPEPIVVDRVFADITHEALIRKMAAHGLPALWTSSEAGLITGGHNMTVEKRMGFFTLTNALWDGKPYSNHRVTTGSVYLPNPCLSILFAAQPEATHALFGDATASDSGLVARFLVIRPKAMAGGRRLYNGTPREWEVVTTWQNKTEDWLNKPFLDREEPNIIKLAPAARQALEVYYSETEQAQAPGGLYADFKASASKTAEMACRIAGTLAAWRHGPVGNPDQVALEDMEAAIALARYYLNEAQAFMGGAVGTQASRDADTIWEWICDKRGELEGKELTLTILNTKGPNSLRKHPKRRRTAMAFLTESGKVKTNGQSAKPEAGPWLIT